MKIKWVPAVLFCILISFSACAPQGAAEEEETILAEERTSEPRPVTTFGAEDEEYTAVGSLEDLSTEKWSEGAVSYKGKLYKYKEQLQNYLFMGIDNDMHADQAEDGISGGQSDAMFLISLDQKKREVNIIAINRNTTALVDVYDRDGNFLMQTDLPICVQHGYGDGLKLSCMRRVEAVKRLFRGIPVSGYISLNMGGIGPINDAAGGIELTPIESVKFGDVYVKAGEKTVLDGEQAYAYLRARDINVFGSADRRLMRQKQYIAAFLDKLVNENVNANNIYNAGSDYMVASIDIPKLINSAKGMKFDEDHIMTIPGETSERSGYEWYDVDKDGLLGLIMEVFYEET